jgi:hypothetical protein
MYRFLFSIAAASVLFASTAAHAQEPAPASTGAAPPVARRSGFTMELGLGGAFTHVDADSRVEPAKFGLAPLSFGIGGFFSRNVALTFRATGVSLFQNRGGRTEQVLVGSYGPSLQIYVSENVFVGAGVGLGVLYGSPSSRLPVDVEPIRELGFSGHSRVGWAFHASKAHQFSIYTDAIYARAGEANATGITLCLGWQYF